MLKNQLAVWCIATACVCLVSCAQLPNSASEASNPMKLGSMSYSLEVMMAVPPARVWQALTTESPAWWPKDFHTSARTQRFVIESVLGGRAYEDFGNGDGLVWYSVIGVETDRELILAGHLLPPFGGPAITALRLTLSAKSGSTLLQVQDDRFGALGGESPVDGWRLVFDAGLRQYVEAGRRQAQPGAPADPRKKGAGG